MTRLGDLLKFWVIYFVSKVAQMFSDFLAILKNVPVEIKIDLATSEKFVPFLISASGHTVWNLYLLVILKID